MNALSFRPTLLTTLALLLLSTTALQAEPLSPAQQIERVIATSQGYLGTPHRLGGTNRQGIDCSGLMVVSFAAVGMDLPRRSRDQARIGQAVNKRDLRPGDLVFFRQGSQIDHVGLVTAVQGPEVTFIHTSSSRGVIYSRMSEAYWRSHYVTARRPIHGRVAPARPEVRPTPAEPSGPVVQRRDLRFPEASESVLTRRDLKRYLPEQLLLMKYELLATHGYAFSDREMRRHFNQYEWYRDLKKTRNLRQVYRRFSDIEQRNYRILVKVTS